MRRLPAIVASVASLSLLAACTKKRTYDDAPIAREDRKKKSAEPPETFDVDAICGQLVDLSGAAIDATQKPDLREMCRKGLIALEKDRPGEFVCRCTCIRSAGDLSAVERCERYCIADDPERVCAHVVGVLQDTNDAGGIEHSTHECVGDLKKLHDSDLPRWSCSVRCLVSATSKEDTFACASRCKATSSSSGESKPPAVGAGDAGSDGDPGKPWAIEGLGGG